MTANQRSFVATASLASLSLCVVLANDRLSADTITITPSKDNTLIEPALPGDPLFSNGLGALYCGKTRALAAFTVRRCAMAFDVAGSVPAGSTINSASLAMRLEIATPGDQPHTLHRLLADWGQGTSLGMGTGSPATDGDVTWLHGFYDTTLWSNPGGDFAASISASAPIGSDTASDYVWASPQMTLDVQGWLDAPTGNFGWIMIGNEVEEMTAKGFFSREAVDEPLRPRLTIDFTPPKIECPADIDGNGAVDVDDLVAVILSWGCTNPPGPCDADVNNSGTVDVDDLVAVVLNWGPCR